MNHRGKILCFSAVILSVLLSSQALMGQVTHRPISDLIDQQVSGFMLGDNYWAFVDFNGAMNKAMMGWGHEDFGTSFSGNVTESLMPDGRTHVSVVLQTRNAVVMGFDPYFNQVFGYYFEVLDGASPALGDSQFKIDFAYAVPPGGKLPDIGALMSNPTPDQEILGFSIIANARGPLREAFGVPEGTPGMLQITGIMLTGPGRGKPFFGGTGVPALHVTIKQVGN